MDKQITTVSNPRGDSFEEARMTYNDVLQAMEKGTVIFNAAGAHIPKLAGPCLAVTDATNTPNAVNLYLTTAGRRTSAPPHTDKQDVVVVQSTGRKHWRVYAPPNPILKPHADVYARGKGDDSMPLESDNNNSTSHLLLETDLNPGDVLFVPAGFPHTTSTASYNSNNDVDVDDDDDTENNNQDIMDDETSVHMTFNIDTHVWDLNYLSARRLALRKANVIDTALGQSRDEDNPYVGKVNELPTNIHQDLLGAFPLDFLRADGEDIPEQVSVDAVTADLKRIAKSVDLVTFQQVDDNIWQATVERLKQQGQELVEIHRDMYLAAMEEGKMRRAEEAMTAHILKDNDTKTTSTRRKTMSPERIQRLSLFRVQRYYEKINQAKADLLQWSYAITADTADEKKAALPTNWAFTMPVSGEKFNIERLLFWGLSMFLVKWMLCFANLQLDFGCHSLD
jgi:hypothetical protein